MGGSRPTGPQIALFFDGNGPRFHIVRVLHSFRRWLVIGLVGASLLTPAAPVSAKTKNGLALGGEAGLVNSGLSAKYAIDNFHIQLLVGMDFFSPDQLDVVDYQFATTLRALYAVARMREETNFFVGAGVTVFLFNNVETGEEFDASVTFELLLGVEHFFNDFFAVSGYVGIPFAFDVVAPIDVKDPDTGEITTRFPEGIAWSIDAVAWGAGFHFYF